MKYLLLSLLVLLGTFSQRVQAVPFTNYLDATSNLVATAYAETTNAAARGAHAVLGKALKDFQKPSTSVAGDYNIFMSVALHLTALSHQKGVGEITNEVAGVLYTASSNFIAEAAAELIATSNRVTQLSRFQPQAVAANKNFLAAQRAFSTALSTSNPQIALLSLRTTFQKLTIANKLAAAAEAKPGLAANSLAGHSLFHTEKPVGGTTNTGLVTFTDDTNYSETHDTGPETGTYTYTRTGLNTAKLVLTRNGTTTVNLTFTTATTGKFSFVDQHEGGNDHGTGTFTLDPQL